MPACIYGIMCMQFPLKYIRGHLLSGTKVTAGGEPIRWYWNPNPGPLQEYPVLLTTDPSLLEPNPKSQFASYG